jgi:hypothetical protein
MINVNNGPGGAGWNNPHAGQPAVICCVYLKAVWFHLYLQITPMPCQAQKKLKNSGGCPHDSQDISRFQGM